MCTNEVAVPFGGYPLVADSVMTCGTQGEHVVPNGLSGRCQAVQTTRMGASRGQLAERSSKGGEVCV